ncbi:hypothetical protein [Actinoplanes sp. NPDC049118]|uniref:hypothetical protein n=1 Tax=Actinoplanes sp. NPDC049118 TaxID=3155769 RepID=UPI0033FF4EC2
MSSGSSWRRFAVRLLGVSLVSLFVPAAAPAAASAGTSWRIVDLGAGEDSVAVAVNDRGHVLGTRSGTPFLWRDGRITELDPLPNGFLQVTDVNNRDEVVGWAFANTDFDVHAYLWRRGTMTDLGVLPGGSHSYAAAINDRGDVVGYSETAGGPHAFRWREGVLTDLGGDPVTDYSVAHGVNNTGQIVGEWGDGNYSALPVRWWHGNRLLLTSERAGATAVNERGHIIGSYQIESGAFERGFLWRSGRFSPIDPPAGATYFVVRNINDHDHVVGFSANGYSDVSGAVWQDGQARKLPKLGDRAEAYDINDRDQIAGYSTTGPDGRDTRAVLWVR